MTRSTGQRAFHFKMTQPTDPAVTPFAAWSAANQAFYADFRTWLVTGGYGYGSLSVYGIAARFALGFLNKPFAHIDPVADLQAVRDYLERVRSAATCHAYSKGLTKLAQYLRFRCGQPEPRPTPNWATYLDPLPLALGQDIRAYLAHCQRRWRPEQHDKATLDLLSHLTLPFRWLVRHTDWCDIEQLTPDRWFDYVDARLAATISPVTLNGHLLHLQAFLYFLAEQGRPLCQRMFKVDCLAEPDRLPRDVPPDQLRRLWHQIETVAHLRQGKMDRAWFLLMLHSGLRTGEVRRLRPDDLDLTRQQVRLEQAKGMKDRIVCLSPVTVSALQDYLAVRGTETANPLFLYRHRPLRVSYCGERLHTYGRKCGVVITPHQLRHSCATLLLNAGVPILTVQTILGHKHIDTTLGYARLYDGTVAADYYRAMDQLERQLTLGEPAPQPTTPGKLLTLVDSLQQGPLNPHQQETMLALQQAILGLAI